MDPRSLAEHFQDMERSLPWWVLLLGAAVGHGFLFIVALNVFYAWPLPRKLMKYTRKVDLLIVAAGPILFAVAMDLFDTRRLSWHGPVWTFFSAYTVLCWIVGFTIAPICEIAYLLRRRAPQLVKEIGETLDAAKELGYAPKGDGKDAKLCSLPLNQVFQVEFTEKTLVLPQIPAAWDGLTILHLTDLHFCGTPDRAFYHWVVERCLKDGAPDLVTVTGDIIDSDWHYRWIVPVLGKLRWNIGGFAILGNHDAWRDASLIRRRVRRLGMTMLGNGWREITVRGERMIVIGHEGPWFTPIPDLAQCPSDVFRMLLSHTPDHIGWARSHKVDLMLAGHVHGGQIRLPVLGSVFVPSRYSRRYDCGTFFEAPTVMHVCRGLAGQHPLRFFCKPEVTRIILRKG